MAQSTSLRCFRYEICTSTLHKLKLYPGPLPLQEAVAIAVEMLEGLSQLHALRILHLDLKPGNVLLDDHGHAYLSDFGISHALRTLEACTAVSTGSSSGTPHYMWVHSLPAQWPDVP